MIQKAILFAFFLLCILDVGAQNHHFAQRALLGSSFGLAGGREDDLVSNYEYYWIHRAGISVSKRWYAGFQTRLLWTEGWEGPVQNFYMAGVFGRWYLALPYRPDSQGRLGAYVESTFLHGNYSVNYQDITKPYLEKAGWYISLQPALEYKLWRTIGLEAGMQFQLQTGTSWNNSGIAFFNAGINWHPGAGRR